MSKEKNTVNVDANNINENQNLENNIENSDAENVQQKRELTINIIDKNITYTKMLEILGYVVESSRSIADNKIHKINGDYMFAGTVLSMFTDYEIGEEPNRDEIMEIYYSDKWGELVQKIGKKYDVFKSYFDAEVELLNAPFASINDTMVKFNQVLESANKVIQAIDLDKIKGFDFTQFMQNISDVNNITQFPQGK